MRLIDADVLEPDADYDDGYYWAVSVAQITNAPTIELDWTELMVICDNRGHAITVKRTDAKPTIEPERTGKWIRISPAKIYECSICGKNVMTADIDEYHFCHGCGARMEETT